MYRLKILYETKDGINETDAHGPLEAVKGELDQIIRTAIRIFQILIVEV